LGELANPGRRRFLLGRAAAPDPAPAEPVAAIGAACLALRGVACMVCRDACPTGALRFSLAIGGVRPRVLAEACTGCGECLAVCPTSAIALTGRPALEAADAR
jgi:ferredoxin-type protein NapF